MKKLILSAAFSMFMYMTSFAQFEGGYTVTITGDKAKEPMDMIFMVKGDMASMVMPTLKANGMLKTIFDRKNKTMIMLMDKNGSKTAMKQNIVEATAAVGETREEPKITFTGETKEISGYKCEKVLIESADATSECWITKALDMNMGDVMGAMSSRSSQAYIRNMSSNLNSMKGVSLVTTSINKKTNEKTTLTLHDIKKEKVSDSEFSIEGFQLMEMPPMPNMGGAGR